MGEEIPMSKNDVLIDSVRVLGRNTYTAVQVSNGIEAKVMLWKHTESGNYSFGTPTYKKVSGKRGPLGKKQYELFRVQSLVLLETFERKLFDAGWVQTPHSANPDNKLAAVWTQPKDNTGRNYVNP